MEEKAVCPHYTAYTLWWTKQEGEKLTCPPDFVRCCTDVEMVDHPMDFLDIAQDYYDAMEEVEEEEEIYYDIFGRQYPLLKVNTGR